MQQPDSALPASGQLRRRLSDSGKTLLLAAVALFVSMVFLHRWVITPLGVESFGRIWHLNASYFDFGLQRRLLEGTIVRLTGLRQFFGVYEFGYFWHTVKLVVLTVLLYRTAQSQLPQGHLLFKTLLFLSPAFLWHFAYAPGNPDLTVMIIAVTALHFGHRRALLLLLLCAGVLTHETFVFLTPGLVVVAELRRTATRASVVTLIRQTLPLALPPMLLSVALFFISGQNPLDRVAFENHMAAVLGPAANKHPYWSGYFELFSVPHQSIELTRTDLQSLPQTWMYPLVPLLYSLALAFLVLVCTSARSMLVAALVSLAMLFPLSISYFANDFYRWISFSCALSLLSLCYLLRQERAPIFATLKPNWIFTALLPVSLLGPFGSNPLTDPFPAARFLLSRIGML